MTDATVDDVAAAADALVAAFGSHDRAAYFASFAPEATFLFHTTDRLLGSRAAYEEEWARWEADGLRVKRCETSDRRIDLVGDDVAVLTHRVRTWLEGVDDPQHERETIVFHRGQDGAWLGVHEHLSPEPTTEQG